MSANENTFILISLKNIKYYKSLYNLIFLYKNELNNLIKNDLIKEHLESNINENNIKVIIKKIEKYITSINYNEYEYKTSNEKKEKELLKLLKLFKKLIVLNKILYGNIEMISNIDIFDQKTLMSDTTKNNIHKNKLHILDIYQLYQTKITINNKLILNDMVDRIYSITIPNSEILSIDELNLVYSIVKICIAYFYKNIIIIDLLCEFIKKIEDTDDSIDNLIYVSKENIKNFTINKELLDGEIKFNSNISIELNNISKNAKKNTYILIKEHLNIVKNLNKFSYLKSYKLLNDIFNKYLDSYLNKIRITNNLNNANFTQIYKFTESYFKQHKKQIMVIIIECKKDNINYNIDNLLDTNLVVDRLSGINEIYIKKTNTIVEYAKNIEENNVISTYISNIQKIHIINPLYDINDKKNIMFLSTSEYNSDVVLIHTNDNNKFDIFTKNRLMKTLKLKDVLFLFHNKPNYRIENYNNIIENNILNQIEKKNILEEYHKNINFDINTHTPANSIEIKNKIIDDIKTKIKLEFNLKNKAVIIDQILDIIIDNISKFIKNKNKIEYNSEIYLTYFSNVSNVVNKFKKEVVDNYDNDFVSKIGEIVENIQSKIVKINENIMDKYYYSNMFK